MSSNQLDKEMRLRSQKVESSDSDAKSSEPDSEKVKTICLKVTYVGDSKRPAPENGPYLTM